MTVYKVNGKVVTEEEFTEGSPGIDLDTAPMVPNTYRTDKPMISESLGCKKSQVPEMREDLRRRGITGAKVLDNGQVEITCPNAHKEVLKMRGKKNVDEGFRGV